MESLQIPTYQTLTPNERWIRSLDGKLGKTQLLSMKRFRVTTMQETMSCIKTRANELLKRSSAKKGKKLSNASCSGSTKENNKFTWFLDPLPNKVCERIAKGEGEEYKHLQSHYIKPAWPLEEGQKYLVTSNIFLDDDVKEVKAYLKRQNNDLADSFFYARKRIYWQICFSLQDNVLLSGEEMNMLLANKVRCSRVLALTGDSVQYDQVEEQVKQIYSVFSSPENIGMLSDATENGLYSRALDTLKDLTCCIIRDHLAHSIEHAISSMMSDQEGHHDEGEEYGS